MPPELMGYQGRSVVIDPDVFAVADVWDLLSRDMQGHAILCRPKSGNKGKHGCLATSVMLLDNARLTHWKVEQQFNEMFEFKRDYMKWVCLKYEDPETIGLFENEWNDFDHLTEKTRMLHNTKRRTQPWKTGLPVDFRPADTFRLFPPRHWIRRSRRALFGDYRFTGHYKAQGASRSQTGTVFLRTGSGMSRSINSAFTAETHDCRDAGGRVMHGAITERTQRNSLTKRSKNFAFFAPLR